MSADLINIELTSRINAIIEAYESIKSTPDTKEYDNLAEAIYNAKRTILDSINQNK